MLVHSVAVRASQTAVEIGDELGLEPHEVDGIHEVQVGELENRNDDEAVEEFNAIYQRWHEGDLDAAAARRRNRRARCSTATCRCSPTCACATSTTTRGTGDIVVVSHGAAIRLAAATLAGVDGSFVLDHHLANAESVVLAPITDGRWSCVHWGSEAPPFYPEPRMSTRRGRAGVGRPDGLTGAHIASAMRLPHSCSRPPRSRW